MPQSTVNHQEDFVINQDDPEGHHLAIQSISTGGDGQKHVFLKEQAQASINFTEQQDSINPKNAATSVGIENKKSSEEQKASIDAKSPGKLQYMSAESFSKGEIQNTIVTTPNNQTMQNNKINL